MLAKVKVLKDLKGVVSMAWSPVLMGSYPGQVPTPPQKRIFL